MNNGSWILFDLVLSYSLSVKFQNKNCIVITYVRILQNGVEIVLKQTIFDVCILSQSSVKSVPIISTTTSEGLTIKVLNFEK